MSDIVYRYLISKAFGPSGQQLAISAATDNQNVCVQNLNYSDDLQLWEVRSIRNGAAFALVNKRTGRAICRASNEQAAGLVTVSLDQLPTNDLAAWRNEGYETFNPINSYADEEQKIHLLGNGPYQPGQQLVTWEWDGGENNEKWAQVPDKRQERIRSINFDMGLASIEDYTPLAAGSQTVTNTSRVEQKQSYTFKFVEGHRYSFTHENGLTVSQSIEFKGGLPILGEAKVIIKAEGSWKYSQEEEGYDEHEVSVEVPVTIPPLRSIRVDVLMLQARVAVPYSAQVETVYPDDTTQTRETSGLFTGVNTYTVVSKYEDLGAVTTNAIRKPLRRF